MKILLMGGTGYLGSNIALALYNAGHEVICVVRPQSDIDRLKGKVKFISNDLFQIELTIKEENPDWIINAVCTYKRNELLYDGILQSNMIYPLGVLNLAVKYGIKNYMTMGTSLPAETNMYSFSKHKLSEFGEYICDTHDFNFADLKLEMFYGGNPEPDDRFLSMMKHKMIRNERIELTEATQRRDIVRVETIVDLILILIKSDYVKGYRRLPIGSGEWHSIREIMEYMKDSLKSDSELAFGVVESRVNEPETRAEIGWYDEIGYKLEDAFWDEFGGWCIM